MCAFPRSAGISWGPGIGCPGPHQSLVGHRPWVCVLRGWPLDGETDFLDSSIGILECPPYPGCEDSEVRLPQPLPSQALALVGGADPRPSVPLTCSAWMGSSGAEACIGSPHKLCVPGGQDVTQEEPGEAAEAHGGRERRAEAGVPSGARPLPLLPIKGSAGGRQRGRCSSWPPLSDRPSSAFSHSVVPPSRKEAR